MKSPRKWITKIRLYRFQSYLDETITFDSKSNAVVGRSDSGKSSISRALYWVLYNRPLKSGKREELATWGEKLCFVTVTFSDKTEITRGRKSDENFYILVKPDGTKLEFKGFGVDVPQEIMDAHGMYKLPVDEHTSFSLNVSLQLDPIFMFNDGSSRRAKTIGKLRGADKVDGALGVLNSWRSDSNAKKKDITKRIKALSSKLEEFNIVEDLEKAILILEELAGVVEGNEDVRDELMGKLTALRELQIQKDQLAILIAFERQLIDSTALESKLRKLATLQNLISESYRTYINTKKECALLHNLISHEESLVNLSSSVDETTKKLETMNAIKREITHLTSIQRDIVATTVILNNANTISEADAALSILHDKITTLAYIQNEYEQYLVTRGRISKGNEVINMLTDKLENSYNIYRNWLSIVQVCPFCASPVTADKIHHLHI